MSDKSALRLSMFALMKFYLVERNPFISLAMNHGAQGIFFCWLMSVNLITTAFFLADSWRSAALLLLAGLALLAGSWKFLPAAQRIHQRRVASKSRVLFPDAE